MLVLLNTTTATSKQIVKRKMVFGLYLIFNILHMCMLLMLYYQINKLNVDCCYYLLLLYRS